MSANQLKLKLREPRPRFKRGDRVQMHPATDRWMRGDKFAEVLSVNRNLLKLKFDRSGKVCIVPEVDVLEVTA